MNAMTAIDKNIALETRYSAPNYAPLPVVLTRGEDSYLWDTERPALRRHDERLFGRQPRPCAIRASWRR